MQIIIFTSITYLDLELSPNMSEATLYSACVASGADDLLECISDGLEQVKYENKPFKGSLSSNSNALANINSTANASILG